jgi:hypothetical protein
MIVVLRKRDSLAWWIGQQHACRAAGNFVAEQSFFDAATTGLRIASRVPGYDFVAAAKACSGCSQSRDEWSGTPVAVLVRNTRARKKRRDGSSETDVAAPLDQVRPGIGGLP